MNERVLNILSMCLQAKEKGHDAFFYYSPHVQSVTIYVHSPHWVCPQKDENGECIIGTDNLIFRTDFYISGDLVHEPDIVKAESFLKGLIA